MPVPCSVIVLTYNSASTIVDCLSSIEPQVQGLGGELLVVDNASSDDTVEVVERLGHRVVQTGGNLGFAAGCNAGAREARGEVLVLANPDSMLDEGCLQELVSRVELAARIGPVGGRGRAPDGSYDPTCVLGRPSLIGALSFAIGADLAFRSSRVFGTEHGPEHVPADGGLRGVPAVSGALMAIPRPLWDALEGFDERYWLYGEDVDLCTRAAALGWRPAMATGAGYRHEKAVSSGGSSFRDVLLFRGKVELYRRHLSPRAHPVAVLALQVGTGLRGVLSLLPVPSLARRGAKWWELFGQRDAWRDGFRGHRPGAEVTAP